MSERSPATLPLERGQAHDDARRAEPALAGPGRREGVGPAVRSAVGKPFEGGDATAGDPADGRDAGDPRRAVDPDGAAAALALRAAAVLDRTAAELLAQRVEEGDPVRDGDGRPVRMKETAAVGGQVDPGGRAARRFGGGAGVAQEAGCPGGPELS